MLVDGAPLENEEGTFIGLTDRNFISLRATVNSIESIILLHFGACFKSAHMSNTVE